MVRSRFLTPEPIIHAIQAGDFYASSGVTLKDVRYDPQSQASPWRSSPRPAPATPPSSSAPSTATTRPASPSRTKTASPLPVTQRYSDDVGKVLATVEGTTAQYKLTGEELYVRAVVTSSQPPTNPSFPHQKAQAWTQPVGWEQVIFHPEKSTLDEGSDR